MTYQIICEKDVIYETIDYYDFKDYCAHFINENVGLGMNLEYLRSLGFIDIREIIEKELKCTIVYIKEENK